LNRRLHAADRRDLQLIGVVLVERQTEHAHALRVGRKTGERLGVVAVDVDSGAILANLHGSLVGGLLLGGVVGALGLGEEELVSAGSLGASMQHLLLAHFARAVLLARDVGDDRPVGERRIHFL